MTTHGSLPDDRERCPVVLVYGSGVNLKFVRGLCFKCGRPLTCDHELQPSRLCPPSHAYAMNPEAVDA